MSLLCVDSVFSKKKTKTKNTDLVELAQQEAPLVLDVGLAEFQRVHGDNFAEASAVAVARRRVHVIALEAERLAVARVAAVLLATCCCFFVLYVSGCAFRKSFRRTATHR